MRGVYGWVLPNGEKHEAPWTRDYDEREDTHDTMAHELGYTNPNNAHGSSIRHALSDGAVRFIRHREGMELEFRDDHAGARQNAIALLTKHKPKTVWMDHPGRMSSITTTHQGAIGRLRGYTAEPKTDIARARQLPFGEGVTSELRTNAAWLSPDGTHHRLEPGEEHHDWAAKHFGIEPDSWASVDKAYEMLRDGWIRKGEKDAYQTDHPRAHLSKILKHVRRHHPEVDTIHVDYPHPDREALRAAKQPAPYRHATISVARPFHTFNGSESVADVLILQRLREAYQPRMPLRANRSFEYKQHHATRQASWISPSGEEHRMGLHGAVGHLTWLRDNLDKVPHHMHHPQAGKMAKLGSGDPGFDYKPFDVTSDNMIMGGWIRKAHKDAYQVSTGHEQRVLDHVRARHPDVGSLVMDVTDDVATRYGRRSLRTKSYRYDVATGHRMEL